MRRMRKRWSRSARRPEGFALAGWIVLCSATALSQQTGAVRLKKAVGESASETRVAAAAQAGSKDAREVSPKKAGRGFVDRRFTLQHQSQIDELLRAFPDISDVTDLLLEDVRVKTIPDELLKQISLRGTNLRSLSIAIGSTHPGETAPEISDAGMEAIARLKKLERLCMACRCSAKGLAQLAKLPQLKILGLDYPSVNARELFEAVAKMPKIQTLGVRYADFSQPIDHATYQAIASLNGRLEWLDFGEFQETKTHPSMFQAIGEIKSLTWLELGNFAATYEDMNAIRTNLLNLEHIGPITEATEGIRTVDPLRPRKGK